MPVGRGSCLEQRQAGLVAAASRIGSDRVDDGRQPCRFRHREKAGAATPRRVHLVGIADEAEPGVAGLDQRACRQLGRGFVVDGDAAADGGAPVDEDMRHRVHVDRRDQVALRGDRDDEAVDAPLGHELAVDRGGRGVVGHFGDQRDIAQRLGATHRAADRRRIDRIGEIRQQDARARRSCAS